MNEQVRFCVSAEFDEWLLFYNNYTQLYVASLICVIGLITNILNILVFTKKDMISPVNVILTGQAVADLAVLLDYIVYIYGVYLHQGMVNVYGYLSYERAELVLWHINFTYIFHNISIWLSIMLATWRYLGIAYPLKSRYWCTMNNTYKYVVLGYLLCPVLCIPSFLTLQVRKWSDVFKETLGESTVYIISRRNNNLAHYLKLRQLICAVHCGLKYVPSLVLAVLSIGLLCKLLKAKEQQQKLRCYAILGYAEIERRETNMDRISWLILVFLFLFLITELPQEILASWSLYYGDHFYEKCWTKLLDIAYLPTLFNATFNFALYYAMSSQFRTTFKSLFKSPAPRFYRENTQPRFQWQREKLIADGFY